MPELTIDSNDGEADVHRTHTVYWDLLRRSLKGHWCDLFRLAQVAVLAAWPVVAYAQNAQLSGIVRDEQGSVIVGAEARLIDEATGSVLATRSNERGVYVFASAKPATYRLEVTANGFVPVTHREVTLHVDQRVALDVALSVAGLQEATDVVGRRSLLRTSEGALGTVIDRQFAAELPLRGRSFTALIALAPGVSLIPGRLGSGDASEFHVNGQRNESNSLMVDGVNGPSEMDAGGFGNASGQRMSSTVTGTVNGGLSIDAVQEIRIQTSTFAAEFGRTPGAQISLVTRSGTNRFSGSLFEQFRNDDLMANDWFANASGAAKPSIEEHQFGATLGGPLVRDRLFFFASYEGLRLDQPVFTTRTVPSIDARNQASPVREILNAYPLPTGQVRPNMTADFTGFFGSRRSSDTWGIRLDQSVRTAQIFGRYSRVPSLAGDDSPFNLMSATNKSAQSITTGLTMPIGTRTLIDLRANYADSAYNYDSGVSATVQALRGWFPPAVPSYGTFDFGVTGLSTLFIGHRPGNTQHQGNVVASLSHVRGAHTLKFGMDYRRLQPEAPSDYTLSARFSSVALALAGTTVSTLNVTHVFPLAGTFENHSFYAQDDWKVRPRLSMTYGLRWDINPPPSFPRNQGPLAVTAIQPVNQLALSSERNVPLWKTEYGNVFPRLGVTYSLDSVGRTLLSGGVGVFGDLTGNAAASASAQAVGVRAALSRSNVALPLRDNDTVGIQEVSISPPYAGNINVVDPQLSTPRTAEWNVTLQRTLGEGQQISVSYVGARGERLIRRTQYTRGVNPNFPGEISILKTDGRSRYQAAQVQYRGRLLRGMQTLASYTFSSSRDTASALSSNDYEWGPSAYDLRHSMNGALSWELPGPEGRAAWALQDWGLHLSGGIRSGYPITAFSSTGFLQGDAFLYQRASLVPGVPIMVEDASAPGGRRFNVDAFVDAPRTEQGNTERNQFRGFGAFQMDVALQRSVRLRDDLRMRVRIEAFNVFNTPVFTLPSLVVSDPFFGRMTSTINTTTGGLYRSGGPRSVGLSVRMDF